MLYRTFLLLLITIFLLSCSNENPTGMKKKSSLNKQDPALTETFTLSSADFTDGGVISSDCACNWLGGKNRPPRLRWHNTPTQTYSFALLMEDETKNKGDQAGKHWSMYNIPQSISEIDILQKQAIPGVTEGLNYVKKNGYAGPCPPRKHTYTFTLYALDKGMPRIPSGKAYTRSQFSREFKNHIIESSTTSCTFEATKGRVLINKVKSVAYKILKR